MGSSRSPSGPPTGAHGLPSGTPRSLSRFIDNWGVVVFRSRVIEMVLVKAPLYSIGVGYVDPKGTTHSEEHDRVTGKYGLDRHTASAYLIALRAIERHNPVQKVII